MENIARWLFIGAAAALLAACGGAQPLIATPGVTSDAADSLPYHRTFHYTGTKQTFKVPNGVTTVKIDAHGAAGGSSSGPCLSRGGRVVAVIPVRPGEKLYVFVGGQGETASGGFNGGGNAGSSGRGRPNYGGGGASDVRQGGDSLHDRILVAGGAGGQGSECGFQVGGKGGGTVGGTGGGGSSIYDGGGGLGGTQYQGGTGGAYGAGTNKRRNGKPGHNGTLGNGGKGGHGGVNRHGPYDGDGGGGGGGGYYGGGGGGGGGAAFGSIYGHLGGGGGGGSSYVEPGAVKFHMWRGWKTATGSGLAVISW